MSRRPATWPQAAHALAVRVDRRDRLGAFLRPVGLGLLAGALVTLMLKALGVGGPTALLSIAVLLTLGALAGLGAARAVVRVADTDAAWALDRLAGAKERGLVAATVSGPVSAEAAWGPGRIEPPPARLLPPRGLSLTLGALLLAAVAALVPARHTAPDAEAARSHGGVGRGTAPTSPAAASVVEEEATAWAHQERALATGRVRRALGLTARAAEDPARVAERLEDPETRAAAREAAAGDPRLGELVRGDEATAGDLAAALAQGLADARTAEAAHRRGAALRASSGEAAVPAGRRDLLARYFAARSPASRADPRRSVR